MARIKLPVDEFNLLFEEFRGALDRARLGMLVTLCGRDIGSIAEGIRWPEPAAAVLRHAESKFWLGDLLQTTIADPNSGPVLTQACERALRAWRLAEAAAAPYSPRDPKAALVLFNEAPFVDRLGQRPHVDDLIQLQGKRVMVVRGDEAAGKSHMAHFVRHLVEGQQNIRLVPVYLHEMGVDLVGALDLMYDLATGMGLPTDDTTWDKMAQEARQAEKLCRWFIGQTQAFRTTGQFWVVLIDGLNHSKTGSGALELVDRLTIAASRGDLVNVCLLLLGMPTPAPAHVASDVADHTLLPLNVTDFRTHVADLAGMMGRQLDAVGTSALVDFLLDQLTFPLGHEGMAAVGQRLRQLPGLLKEA
ncbi:MAG TPA: hypothetical protein VLJ58_11295 [Ramlibacter sp.]|nr:hypothetical protein [Ramlibacter sp.]